MRSSEDEVGRVVRGLVSFLGRRRFPLGSEKGLQLAVESELRTAGLTFTREHRLGASDIPDFFFPECGVVLELKVKGGKRRIHAQCLRYAGYPEVSALVLGTGVAMGFPPELAGKPAYVVSLGRSWL